MKVPSVGDLFYQVFPFYRLLKYNKILRSRSSDRDARQRRWTSLGRKNLLPLIEEEWERAKQLDDKLYKLTTALAVAVTAGGVISKTILDSLMPGPLRWLVLGLLLYGLVSMFSGALMGFSGLRPKPRAGYGPDFALTVRRNDAAAAHNCASALGHFEVHNAIRSNEASAANQAIRNGVIAFAVAITVSLFAPPKSSSPNAPEGGDDSVRILIDRSTSCTL